MTATSPAMTMIFTVPAPRAKFSSRPPASMANTIRMNNPEPGQARTGRRYRPRLLPTLAALVAVVACIAAGNWQQRRMHAKEELLAQYEAARAEPPVEIATVPRNADWPSLRYRAVTATGEYLG